MDDLKRFRTVLFTDAAPFEHSGLLRKHSCRMTSRWYFTGLYGTVHIMSRALESVQKEESQIHEGAAGTSFWKRKRCVEGVKEGFGRDRVCLSLVQLPNAAGRAEAALPLEKLFSEVLAGLCEEKRLSSVPNGMREHTCVDEVGVLQEDVRMVFLKSGF